MSNPQKHSLNALRDTDYTDTAAKVNQGIVNNRPEGVYSRVVIAAIC